MRLRFESAASTSPTSRVARSAIAFLANIIEQFVGAQIVRVDFAPGRGDQLLIESEALGNGSALERPGNPIVK